MINKIIGADQVLALLFLSTDVSDALTPGDIGEFFKYYLKIRRANKSNYILEINFPMYNNFDKELFQLDEKERIIMNPNMSLFERKECLKKIYDNMIYDEEIDVDNDFRMTMSFYHQKYLNKKQLEEAQQNQPKLFSKKRKYKSSGDINGKN